MNSGPSTTQERTIEAVSAVELDTSGTLNVTQGEQIALTVTAGENVIDRLTSEVDAGVLHLGVEGEPLAWSGDIRYELTVPTLDMVTVLGSGTAEADFTGAAEPVVLVKGSGSVQATGIMAETVSITLDGSGSISLEDIEVQDLMAQTNGSGEISVSGTTVAQSAEIRGSGDYRAQDLQSTDARIVMRGSGMAAASVSGTLDAVIDGSGEIRYSGDPEVREEISGSGSITAG